MKTSVLAHRITAAAVLLAFYCLATSAQTAKRETAATTAQPKPAATTSGYLNQSPPSGLRFAPPPKPPVASLPPLPITYDPQPVFSPDFAQPLSEFPVPPKPRPTAAQQLPQNIEVTELASILTNRTEKIPASISAAEAVSPQMLIKFFQTAKPAEVQLLMPSPVTFRVPVREERPSSSATYQVK